MLRIGQGYDIHRLVEGRVLRVVNNTPSAGHGRKGMLLLFVDGHSQFAAYSALNPTFVSAGQNIYNLDWTAGGLTGADLR